MLRIGMWGGLAATLLGMSLAPSAEAATVSSHQNGLIAFSTSCSSRYGCGAIDVTDANGTTAHQVWGPDQWGADNPTFSPDGFHIAFNDGIGINVVDLTGADEQTLVPGVQSAPSWTPDGQHLVFANGTAVDEVDMAGNVRTLFNPPQQPGTSVGVPDVSVSPDGKRIALPLNTVSTTPPHLEIFVANIDGTNLHQITQTAGSGAWGARWAPDGQRLVYWTIDPPHNILTVGANGGTPTLLKAGTDLSHQYASPSFSPDGSQIVYWGPDGISRMNGDGSNVQPVPAADQLNGTMPSWGAAPTCPTLAKYLGAYAGFDLGACVGASVG